MKKSLKILLGAAAVTASMIAAAFAGYVAVTRDAVLDEKKLVLSEDTIEIFDENDCAVKVSAQAAPRENVRLSAVPEHTRFAFVDTEDKDFYNHHGFSYKRMLKAAWTNLRARSFKEGASTISQQLVKNTHLSQEKTLKRKLREYKLTRALEKKYSKDEILEKYLNTIYFGHSCFGLKAAAEFYFGKEPSELTLADSAVLAGLIRSPNNYSPFRNPENCLKRKKLVLSAMQRQGHIGEREKQEALDTPLPSPPAPSASDGGYFGQVFAELEELSEKYDFTIGGTLRIYTYLDADLQEYLGTLDGMSETDKTYAVLSNDSCGIRAWHSTIGNARRLPGSLIKPLLVYAPAIEENILSPATPILDEKTDFGGYEPGNYGGVYSGYMSAREALSKSANVPAVKVLASLGVEKGAAYLEKTGLHVPEEDYSLALALGGMREGFSAAELLGAYATFPNGGIFRPARFIRKVVIDGIQAYGGSGERTRAFSEETSYLIDDMLKTAAESGTAKKLRSLPFPVAAKTGTHGTESGNTDAYALSYTTRDTALVWLGNADNSPTQITGGGRPADILLKIDRRLYENSPPPDFARPSGVERADLDRNEYYVSHNMILADERAPVQARLSELFKRDALPAVRSDKYSSPSVSPPEIRCEDGKVIVRLHEGEPEEYEYLLEKFDSVTHSIVYRGKYTSDITDEELEPGKTYVYTLIPLYGEIRGKEIVLPAVTTQDLPSVQPETPPPITDKNWWEY